MVAPVFNPISGVIIPKEDLPPKGKINGYFVFTKEYRVDHPPNEKTLAGNQVLVKEVSAAWNALSEDEKAVRVFFVSRTPNYRI